MNNLTIEINWELGNYELAYGKYLTDHTIKINDQMILNGGSAPGYGGSQKNLNPEQALAVAVSSCHMMTFLALAAKMSWPVTSYKDNTIATLGKNSKGQMLVTKIELNPKVEFSDGFSVDSEKMKKVQERAHRYCFIANSLSDEVKVIIS